MLLYRLPSDKENTATGRVFLFESSAVDSLLTADTFISHSPPYSPCNVLLHFLFLLSSMSCCSLTVSRCGYPGVLRVE